MEPKKRLGKGLEDISHLFLSPAQPPQQKSALTENRPEPIARGSLPRVIGVISGTPDIPTIFWTGHLALALARDGKKVLVVDVGTDKDELASVLQPVAIQPSLGDLLDQPEKAVTVDGPLGLRVLAFQMQREELRRFKQEEREILFQILRKEEQQADALLLNISFDWTDLDALSYLKCLHEAVLVVSTRDLLGAYRILKVLVHVQPGLRVGLVEYREPEATTQTRVDRIVMASKEFLKRSPLVLGWIPSDSFMMQSIAAKAPLLLSDQEGPGLQALLEIGKRVFKGLNGQESRGLFFDAIQAQLTLGS